ncbi:MAG: hypothetical protein LUH14_06890 [Clostridiaceae bacterium]|nr:hypothetical protein [Clostridiaceae bacterium]
MDEGGCIGGLIGIGIVIYLIYLFVVYVLKWLLAAALTVILLIFTVIGVGALIIGAIYGLAISAYNYVEAVNRVFGERVNYDQIQSENE